MADGTYLTTTIANVPIPRLLFPMEPQPNETLLGFVVRCVERNRLGTPVSFMRAVGLELKAKGDFLNRLQAELPALAQAFSMPVASLDRLWGTEPLTEDRRRRLGGVWLRPALVEQTTRRTPPSIDPGEPDDARWMIRPIRFCSTRWEVLIDRCPSIWCGKVLTWPRADSLHLCRHCGTPLNTAPRQTIPRQHRGWLRWIMTLFSDEEGLRQAAVRRVPTSFQVETETEVFELLLAFQHAFKVSAAELSEEVIDDLEDEGDQGDWRHWVAAARFMLEYPRSHWDILQKRNSNERAAFHHAFKRIAHNSNVPIVRSELIRINLGAGHLPTSTFCRKEASSPEMSASTAARELGVTPGALRQLVEAKMLTPLRSRGARHRINFYAATDIDALKVTRSGGMSCSWFRTGSALPEIAIEQLVALGHLEFCQNPTAALLYGDSQLRAEMAEPILERIYNLPLPPSADGWITLTEAFMGVGGREKPWGPILAAWLRGNLPGGLTNDAVIGPPVLSMSAAVARSLLMGGPSANPWFSFQSEHYGDLRRDWFSPGETAAYLNCSAVEISFLLEKGHLHPLADQNRTRFARSEVEDFAQDWMNTREAAARLECRPGKCGENWSRIASKDRWGGGFTSATSWSPLWSSRSKPTGYKPFGLNDSL